MRLRNKHPSEVKLLTLPFGDDIERGLTILAYEVLEVTVMAGTDPSPLLVLDGDGVIDQTTLNVYQRVRGGVSGCDYFIDTLATDSNGLKHVIQFTLPVRSRIAPT